MNRRSVLVRRLPIDLPQVAVTSKAKKRRRQAETRVEEGFPPEEQRAEMATIVWMLAALFAFSSEMLGLGVRLFFRINPDPPDSLDRLALVPGLTLMISLVAGGVCLLLTPVVYRLRKTKPPDAVTIGVVLIGLMPYAVLASRWFRAS